METPKDRTVARLLALGALGVLAFASTFLFVKINRRQLSQPDDGSLPILFLVVLAFWLFVLFSSFGLFSPRNGTVITVLFVCALSVAGAVLLIVDLDQPFEGLLQVSGASLRNSQAQFGQSKTACGARDKQRRTTSSLPQVDETETRTEGPLLADTVPVLL